MSALPMAGFTIIWKLNGNQVVGLKQKQLLPHYTFPLLPLEQNTQRGQSTWILKDYSSASLPAIWDHRIKFQQRGPSRCDEDNGQVLPLKESGCHSLPSSQLCPEWRQSWKAWQPSKTRMKAPSLRSSISPRQKFLCERKIKFYYSEAIVIWELFL